MKIEVASGLLRLRRGKMALMKPASTAFCGVIEVSRQP